jgi:hypothetical protein
MPYRYGENPSASGSAACIVELEPVAQPQASLQQPTPALSIKNFSSSTSQKLNAEPKNVERNDFDLPPPSTAVSQLQKWNSPRINMWRVFSTFYSFIVLGLNDAAYGVRALMHIAILHDIPLGQEQAIANMLLKTRP